MIADPVSGATPSAPTSHRPRIALMGEFSAGKSTLANLLLGHAVSPVKVTATQLPPVWYRRGPASMLRVDAAGVEHPLATKDLHDVSHRDTQAVRVSLQADVLEFCELIDMPGTSDPNLPEEIWTRMIDHVDGVIWCTPATQAWRQTEAALWESLPDRLRQSAILLITRIDKISSEADRTRIAARVRGETEGLFKTVIPISLTEAVNAGEDTAALEASGADAFVASLLDIVEGLKAPRSGAVTFEALTPAPTEYFAADQTNPAESVQPRRVGPRRDRHAGAWAQSGA